MKSYQFLAINLSINLGEFLAMHLDFSFPLLSKVDDVDVLGCCIIEAITHHVGIRQQHGSY